jgi:hypothetical protein
VKKLDDKQFRPFKILEKFGASADKLELPGTWKAIHPVFNESVSSPPNSLLRKNHPRLRLF